MDEVRLGTKTGFESHLDVTGAGSEPGGVWLEPAASVKLGAKAGDTITVSLGDRTAEVPVAGVYTASQSDPYWAEMLATTGGDNQPGSLAVLDRDAFLAPRVRAGGLGPSVLDVRDRAGADRTLTLDLAAELADGIERFDTDAADPRTLLGTVLSNPTVTDR